MSWATGTMGATNITELNGTPIPAGCICGYTWDFAAPGRIVRNGGFITCPANHEVTP